MKIAIALVLLASSALAADLDVTKVCGNFAFLNNAEIYSGGYENTRPHALVILGKTNSGKAIVLYAWGLKDGQTEGRPGCSTHFGQIDFNVLSVSLGGRRGATVRYEFVGDGKVKVEWRRRSEVLRGELTAR